MDITRTCEPELRQRRGVTLIELLVVVAILIMLIGVSAAMIHPLRQGRDIREGAREVHAYLSLAQAQAIQRQRPVGVWLLRSSQDNSDPNDSRQHMSLELAMGEVPPPYAGDTLSSLAVIEINDPNLGKATLKSVSGANDPPRASDLVQVGDYIRLTIEVRCTSSRISTALHPVRIPFPLSRRRGIPGR